MQTKKYVLITGGCSGIGGYLADNLEKDGYYIIRTSRKGNANILPLDVRSSYSILECLNKVKTITKGNLFAVINNAGMGYFGNFIDLTRNDLRDQFEVNIFGLHELTVGIIKMFMNNGNKGRIINIGSINGKISFPHAGAYSSSKHALEALTDSLRLELKHTDIKVSLIEPSTILSGFRKNAVWRNMIPKEKPYLKCKSPNITYRQVKHALESRNPRARYITIKDKFIVLCKHLAPDLLFDKIFKIHEKINTIH